MSAPKRDTGLALEVEKKSMDQSSYINLKVKVQNGMEVFFRINRNTKLKKLMEALCDRRSLEKKSTVFLFNGRRFRGDQTPDELEMEEGDEIDVMLHHMGGGI